MSNNEEARQVAGDVSVAEAVDRICKAADKIQQNKLLTNWSKIVSVPNDHSWYDTKG